MGGFQHVAVPANEEESQIQELDDGPERKIIAIGGADPIAFPEGVMFVRHGGVLWRVFEAS